LAKIPDVKKSLNAEEAHLILAYSRKVAFITGGASSICELAFWVQDRWAQKLGTHFAIAGHEVVFSYARSEQKLKMLAKDAKGKAKDGTPREAVAGCGCSTTGRALVENRRCAESGRRFVRQGGHQMQASR
jgi:NAD(P)-dependent dehydrogenase (short-subunit alcohol dehydrogenase family)